MEENKEPKMPERQIAIQIEDNRYEIKVPNNVDFIRIQTLKGVFTRGGYDDLISLEVDKGYAKITTDMLATFTVLIPQLSEDLNVEGLANLDIFQTKNLIKVYVDDFFPWWRSVLDYLGDSDEVVKMDDNITKSKQEVSDHSTRVEEGPKKPE